MESSVVRQIVQSLLRPADTCVYAVQGRLRGLADLVNRLCAVVKHEAKEEYALFIFSLQQMRQPPLCVLEGVYPIQTHFSAHTQAIKSGWSEVLITTGDGSTILLNISGDQFPQVFISQLTRASQLFNQLCDSSTAFDWLVGYEKCRTGWDRFSKPHPPSFNNPFLTGDTAQPPPLELAFPEKWPWSHIITPNTDGSTDVASCEQDLSEFDPFHVSNNGIPTVAMDTAAVNKPATTSPPSSDNPFVPSTSTDPFSSSPTPPPPPSPPPSSSSSYLVPTSERSGMRGCTSESNLRRLQIEVSTSSKLGGNPHISRSSDNLLSLDENERHCVAGGLNQLKPPISGSTSSVSSGGWDNVELEEEVRKEGTEDEGLTTSLQLSESGRSMRKRGWGLRGRKTVTGGQEVEVVGRRRLNHSPDLRDLRKPREAVRLRFKKASGSQTGPSKANMEQPELSSHLPLPSVRQRQRVESRKRSSSQWISRYRPGVSVPQMNIRETIVQAELRQKEKEFCDQKTLRVFCGTWNVNGKPPSSSLDQFLREFEGQGDSDTEVIPDIYAIGFQELDLSAQALMGAESSREEPWTVAVETTLTRVGSYQKLLGLRLVGILLLVYVRQHLFQHVSDQDSDYVTTGIGGIMGNKGGVSVRFNLFHTSFCFINCHFAASMEEVEKRNNDYHTIRNKTSFSRCPHYKYTIMEHDMVFWMGDMNYRIQTSPEMTGEMIKAQADNFQISALLREDQLVQEMTKGTIFSEFAEGAIDFKPTYKYDPNTDNWDSSEKHRPPAWCDRILYHGMGAELRGYRSHPKLKISDHKPVSAVFDTSVRVVDPGREKEALEEITRKLDKLENDTLPQVDLSQTEFIFKDVKFLLPQSKKLIITNTGSRPVLVSFIPKLDEEAYSKPWIEAKPSSAVLQPLHDIGIVLTVSVDCDTASTISSGKNNLDDILVLHLEGGKDFFLSITGNYLPSCFGSSLDTLVHLHTYIREVPTADLLDLSFSEHSSLPCPPTSSSSSPAQSPSLSRKTTPPHDIPKELYQLVSYLDSHLETENLFQESGRQVEVLQIIDALDVGGVRELPGSTHSVAQCLVLFLSALSEPVIPTPLHQRAMDCSNQPMLCKQLLLNLPRVNQRTFTFLMSFMKRLLLHSDYNGLDAKLLATIFGDIILRTPANQQRTRSKKQLGPMSRKKSLFVYQFLIADLTADYR